MKKVFRNQEQITNAMQIIADFSSYWADIWISKYSSAACHLRDDQAFRKREFSPQDFTWTM